MKKILISAIFASGFPLLLMGDLKETASFPLKSGEERSRARQTRFSTPSTVTESGTKPMSRLSPDTVEVGMKRVFFIMRGEILSAESTD